MTAQHEGGAALIGELFPDLPRDELHVARDNLDQYVAMTLTIFERLQNDPEAFARFKGLTPRRSTS